MKIRDRFISLLVHGITLPVVRLLVTKDQLPVAMDSLRDFPPGSLGRSLHEFLQLHGYSLIPHFETHDAKHVLLDYGVTGKDEGCMQFFYIGNRHYSPATILTAISSVLLLPECTVAFYRAFRRGRQSLPVGKLKLGELLHCSLHRLKAEFRIPDREETTVSLQSKRS